MPTMTLLPDATGISHFSWQSVGEVSRHLCLDDDNGDTSYVKSSTTGRSMIIGYADPSVAEGDIVSIDSVRFLSSGRHTGRSGTAAVDIAFTTIGVSAYSETAAYDASPSSYETINGTARTYATGTTAWSYTNLENLQMICTKSLANEVRLSYLALEVTYTEAVAVTDNATFFGANF